MATERERESTLTLLHICHRPRIPGRHVLIERRCPIKHCKKRERVQQRKEKDQTHHTNNNNNKGSRVSNHKPKQRTKTCENCDPTNLKMSYVFNNTPQTQGAVATERKRERVHLLLAILVTAPVFQVDTF